MLVFVVILISNYVDLVLSRFTQSAIDDLMRKNIVGFTDNKIEIEISSGPFYPAIKLTVHEFQPSNPEFLALLYMRSKNGCQFRNQYSLPLGIHDTETKELREKCLSHIQSIADGERYFGELCYGDTSVISWVCFEAINRYRKSCLPSKQVR
jgi:hypothetical protein